MIGVLATAASAGTLRTITGTAKADRLTGTARADAISGLGGNDRLTGLGGNDLLVDGPGNDTIGGAGVDRVRCGTGRDTVQADGRDSVSRDCEKVTRPKPPPADDDPPATPRRATPPRSPICVSAPSRRSQTTGASRAARRALQDRRSPAPHASTARCGPSTRAALRSRSPSSSTARSSTSRRPATVGRSSRSTRTPRRFRRGAGAAGRSSTASSSPRSRSRPPADRSPLCGRGKLAVTCAIRRCEAAVVREAGGRLRYVRRDDATDEDHSAAGVMASARDGLNRRRGVLEERCPDDAGRYPRDAVRLSALRGRIERHGSR